MIKKMALIISVSSLMGCHYLQTSTLDPKPIPVVQGKLESNIDSIKKNFIDRKCLMCHKAGGPAENLPFETVDQIISGVTPDSQVPLIVPGKSTESALYRVISTDPAIRGDLAQMPSKKALAKGYKAATPEELQIIEAWINGTVQKPEPNQPAPTQTPIPNPPSVPVPAPTIPEPTAIPSQTPTPTNIPAEPVPTSIPQPTSIPEPISTPAPQPMPIPDVTFAMVQKTVIEVKCLTCHKPGGKADTVPFTTQDEVIKGVTTDDMPLVTIGLPLNSAFYQVLSTDPAIRGKLKKMPPLKAISAGTVPDVTPEDLKLVEQWILQGAH